MTARPERPDLAEIRKFAADVIAPGLWWSENVPAVRELLEQAMGYFLPLLDYALQLEQDAAALRERLAYLAAAQHNGHAVASGWTFAECGIAACAENRAILGAAS